MKKIFSSIFILIITASLFAPFSVNLQNNTVMPNLAEAGTNCKFVSTAFSPAGQQAKGWKAAKPKPGVTLTIETSDCIGEILNGYLYEHDGWSANDSILSISDHKITQNKLVIDLTPGEEGCNNGDCQIIYRLFLQHGDKSPGNFAVYNSGDVSGAADELDYDCADPTNCVQTDSWIENQATGAQQLRQITASIVSGKDTLTISGDGPDTARLTLLGTTDTLTIGIYDSSDTLLASGIVGGKNPFVYNIVNDLVKNGGGVKYSTTFTGLQPATTYTIKLKPSFANTALVNLNKEQNIQATTLDANGQIIQPNGTVNQTTLVKQENPDGLPVCSLNPWATKGTFTGCLLQAFYYLVFESTSWLFSKAGQFFDSTFAYSISDASYRTGFVVGGWGIVRDICNVFFIFVLLYVAFSTILNIHGFKTKEMIINVVLIGILINFSLFTTQVIIDTSNILARVFYNSESIRQEKEKPNQASGDTKSKLNEISLSAGLVGKIDPQKILAAQSSVSTNAIGEDADNTTWFITILMSSILNVVGFITFLTVGLLFIARVIGLWIAMVVVPFAFFSYTVPAMQGMDTLGWKKWWPETLKMAFMAPIFMFFVYLLLRFIEKGFSMVADSQGTGATGSGMLAVIIPFLFIMIFLIKAKDMAKSFSGSIGEGLVKGATTIGALALGGAALGAASLGRGVGAGIAKLSRGETATQKYDAARRHQELTGDTSKMDKLKWHQKIRGAAGSAIGLGAIYGTDKGDIDIKTKKAVGVSGGLGGFLNKSKKRVGDVDHARHEYEEAKEKAGLKNVPDSKLSGVDITNIENAFKKGKRAEAESAVRKGENLKGIREKDASGNYIIQSEDEFKKKERTNAIIKQETASGRAEVDFTDADKKAVENDLNVQFNVHLKKESDKLLAAEYSHVKTEAAGVINGSKVNQFERVFSKSNTGTWDVRNLGESKTDKRAGILTKLGVGAVAGIALGVRTGLKGFGTDHGKGQGNFLKDLGSTLSDAIKNVNIKVSAPSGGHGGGHDDHGGGHDDHGGGHH